MIKIKPNSGQRKWEKLKLVQTHLTVGQETEFQTHKATTSATPLAWVRQTWLRLTDGDVDGVAGRRAEQLGGKAALDPVAATVAALVEGFRLRQRQLHPGLTLVRPLRDQRRRHPVLVQVEVADVVTEQNAAAEADGLAGGEHGVRGQQGEGGYQEGTCEGRRACQKDVMK